jgi:hypothetical protein
MSTTCVEENMGSYLIYKVEKGESFIVCVSLSGAHAQRKRSKEKRQNCHPAKLFLLLSICSFLSPSAGIGR